MERKRERVVGEGPPESPRITPTGVPRGEVGRAGHPEQDAQSKAVPPLPVTTEPVSPRRLGLPEKPKGAWDPSSPEPDTATYLGLGGVKSRTQTRVRQERGLGGKVKGGAHTLGVCCLTQVPALPGSSRHQR